MESRWPTYLNNQKVKLELVQPKIKCNGRDDAKCYYRGVVTEGNRGWDHLIIIKFKYKGQIVEELYDLSINKFVPSLGANLLLIYSIKDIKIKQ